MSTKLCLIILILISCSAGINAAWELIVEIVCFFKFLCVPLPYISDFNVERSVLLGLYNGTTLEHLDRVQLSESALLLGRTGFDLSRRTVFYLHGFTEDEDSESVRTVMGAEEKAEGRACDIVITYIKKGGHNLVLVDWHRASGQGYLMSLKTIPRVTRAIAYAIDDMVRAGMDIKKTHVIGHSLGGQAAGYVGKYVETGRLFRITALDPADVFTFGLNHHLNIDDADVVDVIHTDSGNYGVPSPVANVDFYPNGGARFQPGCPVNINPLSDGNYCSHERSWEYYAESVLNETAFPAMPCGSWQLFQLGFCKSNKNRTIFMGYPCTSRARGKYYLQTNANPPFGKGMEG